MAKLFSNGDIYVSPEVIEVKGDRFSPFHFNMAMVSKLDSEFTQLMLAIGLIGGGLFLMASFGWVVFGFILIAIGSISAYNYKSMMGGKVSTLVTISFNTSRTARPLTYSIQLNNYNEGLELQSALNMARKMFLESLSLAELRELEDNF